MADMTIVRGKAYNMKFIIKQVGASVPMVLVPSDTAIIYIGSKGDDGTLLITKELTQGDAANGEFILNLTDAETILLPTETGFSEDGEVFKSTCRAHVSTVTVESGNGEISIPNVYVINIGL